MAINSVGLSTRTSDRSSGRVLPTAVAAQLPAGAFAELRLTLLGGFQVTRDGTPITQFRGDKVRAVLAYLAAEADRPHARAVLATLFWPEQPDREALANLSQTLTRLRGALGDEGARIHVTRHEVTWHSHGAAVDVASFTRLAGSTSIDELERAAALYGGEFLAGFGLHGCDGFEEWLLLRREQLRQLALSALERLADEYAAAARWIDVAGAARRQLALDPWHEDAHRQLMRALAAAGDRAGALAAYERCRATLLAELGVEPDTATVALAEQLRHAQPIVPPAATRPAHASVLPAPLTPLLGRAAELATLDQLLRGEARLVTLLGTGGVGKTRLALEAATRLREAFSAGACWVALAGISESGDIATQAEGLAGTTLEAIGIPANGQRPPHEVLRDVLRDGSMLLVLDNCEHLPAVGPFVAELLAAAPGLCVLATSRERLGVYGEELLVLDGLPVPDEHAGDLDQAAAVQLFVARARRQVRSFASDAATLAGVVRLCRVLEGMPLGIELAAHWAGEYGPDEIAAAVQADLDFLQTRDRTVTDRHRSLRAVFDYSWRLLSEAEQRALARLSVFAGGFDRQAALEVAEVRSTTLAALVDKSLLRRVNAGRYSLHELLRQFAAGQLDGDATERATIETRHGAYYLQLVAARARRLGRDEPREAAAEIRTEIDNVRQAWSWGVRERRVAELAQAAFGWWQFCLLSGQEAESRRTFALAVERLRMPALVPGSSTVQPPRGLSTLLAIHANHLFSNAPYEQMAAEAREAIRLGALSGDLEGETLGSYVLGRALQELEQQRDARAAWKQTIRLARSAQPRSHDGELSHEAEWLAYTWLFGSSLFFEDYAGGRACVVEALRVARALGKRRAELFSLSSLAMIDFYQGDDLTAEQRYERVIPLARALDDRWAEMRVHRELSEVLRVQGMYVRARTLLVAVVATARELGNLYEEMMALAGLVRVDCQLGDTGDAGTWHAQLIDRMEGKSVPRDCVAEAMRARAVYALCGGDHRRALANAEQAWQISQRVDIPTFRADSAVILGHARAALSAPDAAAAYEQAVSLYRKTGNTPLAREPQAGLAALALLRGDGARARTLVDALLPALAERPRARVLTPFYTHAICYRVLAATGDTRADDVLHTAVDALERQAALIDDREDRRMFLESGAAHRVLVRATGERAIATAYAGQSA